uniref:Phospholipid-transporting ATPase n=1 Tax=Ananas comosus var. bracteatus TaxID=296719 RepID=A0A6V7Q5I4_ANACO|nr:unnamed protein product [Ananas comosus var. bracteatus]
MKRWYLRPDDTTIYFDPNKAALSAFFHFLTAMMLYSYFIPISLYISIEIVKLLQALFINRDIEMYHEESDKPAHARTSNLTEELGQVDTILSDKTGTLTCNSMEFVKCSIAGTAYGRGITEVEKAMARRKGSPYGGNWIREPHADVIEKFFRLLAICHTCIPEIDEETRKITYEAESPDEAAFVIAARELGFEFYQRTQTTISLHEFDPISGHVVERSYRLLNILEFSSARKRMSVIVRDEEGRLLLLSKGADSVMFERLAKDGTGYEEATRKHINDYADAGLRTLVLAYRELDEEEDLVLLGATAVEDKLQNGVPECIDKLAQAGIKLWVLTGDKMETAINIGFACSLLRQGMKQIIITLETPDIIALEKSGNKEAVAKVINISRESVVRQINEGQKLVSSLSDSSFALIIDGKSLTYALEDDAKNSFLQLAISCGSVICCRSSPKQKALVTRLVKEGTRKVTLAIGDGANDVGMLQEADIGIGISGAEGMQAVMSSDVAIAQFRFLERLLLVHGHWCYRRISSMICYFFYKNITFGFTLFFYEAYTSFSGEPAYNDWFLSLYNVLFTSLPVIALGVFDQDVSARYCLKVLKPISHSIILKTSVLSNFPMLYQEGVQNVLFSWTRILGWMLNGLASAAIIFFFCTHIFQHQAFRIGGEVADFNVLGAAMYTCVVWVVNCQMALSVSYFTLIQHVFIWGGIALWYLFLVVYGAISPDYSTTAYMVLRRGAGPRAVVLDRHPVRRGRDPRPVLQLRGGPDAVLPDVPQHDPVDSARGPRRRPRVLPDGPAAVGPPDHRRAVRQARHDSQRAGAESPRHGARRGSRGARRGSCAVTPFCTVDRHTIMTVRDRRRAVTPFCTVDRHTIMTGIGPCSRLLPQIVSAPISIDPLPVHVWRTRELARVPINGALRSPPIRSPLFRRLLRPESIVPLRSLADPGLGNPSLPISEGSRNFATQTKPTEVKTKVPLSLFGGSGNYASALFLAASKANILDKVESEILDVVEASKRSPVFSQFIKDLSVPKGTRVKAINEIFSEAGFSDVTKNFLAVLADNGRLKYIERIAKRFVDLTMAHRGEVKVIVTSVISYFNYLPWAICEDLKVNSYILCFAFLFPATSPQKRKKSLSKPCKIFLDKEKTVKVEQKIDPSILGGLVVEFAQKVFDMSIRTRAKQMEKLLREPLHV